MAGRTIYCCKVCAHYFILGESGEYLVISREVATALVLAGLHTFNAAWCPVCRDMSGTMVSGGKGVIRVSRPC